MVERGDDGLTGWRIGRPPRLVGAYSAARRRIRCTSKQVGRRPSTHEYSCWSPNSVPVESPCLLPFCCLWQADDGVSAGQPTARQKKKRHDVQPCIQLALPGNQEEAKEETSGVGTQSHRDASSLVCQLLHYQYYVRSTANTASMYVRGRGA